MTGEGKSRQMTCEKAVLTDFEACNRDVGRHCGAYRVDCDRWWEFRGGVRASRIGSLDVTHIHISHARVVKDRRRTGRGLADRYFLVLQESGAALMRQRGNEVLLRPGDCTLIDSRHQSVFEASPNSRQALFHLPASAVRDRIGPRSLPVAEPIDGSSGVGGMLSDMLTSLVRHGESLNGVDPLDLTLHLVGKLIASRSETCLDSVECFALEPGEIAAFIDTHIHRDDLTPRSIAEYFGISLRQLYRIATSTGSTPAAMIWRRRLERARATLGDSASNGASITEIALTCGFKDGAHFSRSYRKAFGETPRATRERRSTAKRPLAVSGTMPEAGAALA